VRLLFTLSTIHSPPHPLPLPPTHLHPPPPPHLLSSRPQIEQASRRPWRSRTRSGRSHAHDLDLEGFGSHGDGGSPPSSLSSSDLTGGAWAAARPRRPAAGRRRRKAARPPLPLCPASAWSPRLAARRVLGQREERGSAAPCSSDARHGLDLARHCGVRATNSSSDLLGLLPLRSCDLPSASSKPPHPIPLKVPPCLPHPPNPHLPAQGLENQGLFCSLA
jgi:hypothetical protein